MIKFKYSGPNKIRLLRATFIILAFNLLSVSCESVNEARKQDSISQTREKENFGIAWQFQRIEDNFQENWEVVNIPHTVRIEPLIVNDQWQGRSIYRKFFKVSSIEDKKWFFHFEGVMQEARVSINDKLVYTHKGGFLPFTIDATSFLMENTENAIEVEVINIDDTTIPPGKNLQNLDFNLYGGIYRNIYLIKTNSIYITDPVNANVVNGGGILVHFNSIKGQLATGMVKTHIKNETESKQKVRLRITFSDEQGKNKEFLTSENFINPGEDSFITENISIEDPNLWSTSNPKLYNVRVEVIANGKIVDTQEIRTGIRDIELTGNAFYLNGEKLFINGTNRHQEYPYIGYAISDEAQYRDAYKIKEAGFNFVRLSHYPQATAFLDACDELGLLVMNAIPGWQYFEEGEFVENAIQNIKDMARRDRNHPSVIFWENSLNESGMSKSFIIRANEILKAELPYKDTYSAGWMDHPAFDLFTPARQHAKPPYYWSEYDKPNRPIFIAEYGDWEYYAQNAGFDQKAFSDLKEEERSSRQLRRAGERGLLQQALNYQEAFNSNLKGGQTVGQANWLMFDYNRGYSDNLEASGISDIFRIPKFSYYFYQSQKDPGDTEFSRPMVRIASYWTPESTTRIKVFSNTEVVSLFLNDSLISRKKPTINSISDELPYPPFEFDLKEFVPGELKAIGFIDGKEVATHSVQTPEVAFSIELKYDHQPKPISTNTPDVVFVYARILDKNGTVIPWAENKIKFKIISKENSAKLIGENPINAEAGIATILLRTETKNSSIIIEANSEGLKSAELKL